MAPDLTDAQLDAIAERVATDDEHAASIAQQLPTGRLGGRYLLNRRQLLALATGGATAVAGLTALGVDEAEAQAAAGQVGTPESPEDVFAAALEAQEVKTKTLGSGRHYAGAYSGNDPDARLDAALSAASVGDKIYLEVGTYGSDRTISNAIDIEGAVSTFSESTFLNSCVWTFDAPVSVSQIGAGGPDDVEFNANTDGCCFTNISQNTLTINFATGTDGGVADSIYSSEGRSATVNDPDGNNLIGDVY